VNRKGPRKRRAIPPSDMHPSVKTGQLAARAYVRFAPKADKQQRVFGMSA
jgi:hypothetical protein